jgi:hypothetical protein
MFRTRHIFPLLTLAAVVVASPLVAQAGGKRPQAKIESVSALSGQQFLVTLLAKDRESRDLPLSFEYKVKGVKGWFPATMATDVDAIPSSPEGRSATAVWDAHADLGTAYIKKARLRVTVLLEKGKRKKSKKFEVVLYGDLPGADLRSALYADLEADGNLDGMVLIDTRGTTSFADGSVPGARNLSSTDIEEMGETVLPWPKDTRLVFYCYGGL